MSNYTKWNILTKLEDKKNQKQNLARIFDTPFHISHNLNSSDGILLKSVKKSTLTFILKKDNVDGCGIMVIIVGNGHGDRSSNPRQDWLHFP